MAKSNTKALSCTISQRHFDALEEHRWNVRKNMSEMVDTAIAEYLSNHGIDVAGDPAPADPETAPTVPTEKATSPAAKSPKA